jgi:hypothetical protein
MQDLRKALADISAMRDQMARGTMFRGYGPAALAATGGLAMLAALAQPTLIGDPAKHLVGYVALWVAVAAISVVVIALEAARRSRQAHGGLADDMLRAAAAQFLPALAAGALVTLVLLQAGPPDALLLPGIWQIVFSLGVFASCHSLSRSLLSIGVWYLGTGLLCLHFATGPDALAPMCMGLPFGIGQLFAAVLLHQSYREIGDEEVEE